MPTSNRRVATYLPPPIDEAFVRFKVERGLTTEENPNANDSRALILLLSEYLQVSYSGTHEVAYKGDFVSRQEFEDLKSLVDELSASITGSAQKLKADVVSEVKSELISELEGSHSDLQHSHPGQLDLLASVSTSTHENQLDLPSPLSARKLAERLNIDRKKLASRKEHPDFAAWTQSLDPDKLSWVYNLSDRKYHAST
mgnify:CR=1 FL=1|jgi:hypothetical protein